jgi:hypothetical protein
MEIEMEREIKRDIDIERKKNGLCIHGSLTEREGSVQLMSLYKQFRVAPFYIEKNLLFFTKQLPV